MVKEYQGQGPGLSQFARHIRTIVGMLFKSCSAKHELNTKFIPIKNTGQGVAMDGLNEPEGQQEGMVILPRGAGSDKGVEVDAARVSPGGVFSIVRIASFSIPTDMLCRCLIFSAARLGLISVGRSFGKKETTASSMDRRHA